MKKFEIIANVTRFLMVAGDDLGLEHAGDAQIAFQDIYRRCDEFNEILEIFGHEYSCQVFYASNNNDIAAYFVAIRRSEKLAGERKHGDVIVIYCYSSEADAVTAALASVKRLSELEPHFSR